MENHNFQSVNPLFLWPCSIAMWNNDGKIWYTPSRPEVLVMAISKLRTFSTLRTVDWTTWRDCWPKWRQTVRSWICCTWIFAPSATRTFRILAARSKIPQLQPLKYLDVDGFLTVGTAHKMLLRLTLSTCHYLSDLGLVWSSGCILILWWMLLVNLMSMSLVPFWILWSELSHTISCHFFSQVFAEDVPTVRTLGSNSLLLRVLVLYTYGILCIPLQGSQDVTTEFLGHITGSRFCCASRAKLWPT